MNEQRRQTLEQRLEKEEKRVEKELRSIGRINPSNPKDWEAKPDRMDTLPADPNEVADSIESYEENTAILKQLEIRLNEIKEALERMKAGTYGTCKVCGKPIKEARLAANPAAVTCVEHTR